MKNNAMNTLVLVSGYTLVQGYNSFSRFLLRNGIGRVQGMCIFKQRFTVFQSDYSNFYSYQQGMNVKHLSMSVITYFCDCLLRIHLPH